LLKLIVFIVDFYNFDIKIKSVKLSPKWTSCKNNATRNLMW
jgi:hypothetical protein